MFIRYKLSILIRVVNSPENYDFRKNFWKISGNISKSLEVITSIIFIRICWYSCEPC